MKLLLLSLLICYVFALAVCNIAPVFRSGRFLIVREDTKIGTVIGNLRAVDPDGPGDLVLNITDDATADLVILGPMTDVPNHGKTADIILNTTLDRDYAPSSRKLIFEATDGETTTTGSVTLNIDDVNDNAPQFTQSSYNATVSSNAPVGTVVLIATAVDPDMSYGGIVQYTVIDGGGLQTPVDVTITVT